MIYIAKNDALELNCSVNGTIQEGYLKHLAWKHNSTLIQGNFTRTVINNTTLQLKKNHTQFGDAGVYVCGVFTNSSKIPNITLRHVRVIVGGMIFHKLLYTYIMLNSYLKWPPFGYLRRNISNKKLERRFNDSMSSLSS